MNIGVQQELVGHGEQVRHRHQEPPQPIYMHVRKDKSN